MLRHQHSNMVRSSCAKTPFHDVKTRCFCFSSCLAFHRKARNPTNWRSMLVLRKTPMVRKATHVIMWGEWACNSEQVRAQVSRAGGRSTPHRSSGVKVRRFELVMTSFLSASLRSATSFVTIATNPQWRHRVFTFVWWRCSTLAALPWWWRPSNKLCGQFSQSALELLKTNRCVSVKT